ncbi:MAG: hypothetical protein EOM26_04665 [Alphaproteobacteria bacterium]|nr:hypothetical protein [Alphaproteobacteria bacterium]
MKSLNSNGLSFFLFAVFAYSLYPLIMILGAGKTGAVFFVFLSQLFATLSGFAFYYLYNLRRKVHSDFMSSLPALTNEHWLFVGIVGLCCAVTNIFFIFAASMMNRAGVVVIYDTWPIIAMLLTPVVIQKSWFRIKKRHLFMSLPMLAGIGLIAWGDQTTGLPGSAESMSGYNTNIVAYAGILLALMGSATLALFNVMRIQVSNYLEQTMPLVQGRPVLLAIVSETVCRSAAIPFAMLFLVLFPEPRSDTVIEGVGWAFALGAGVLFLGNSAYVLAMLRATSPSMHLLWYLVPVFAVFWLWACGLGTITLPVIAGAAIVILSNVYLELNRRKDDFARRNNAD